MEKYREVAIFCKARDLTPEAIAKQWHKSRLRNKGAE